MTKGQWSTVALTGLVLLLGLGWWSESEIPRIADRPDAASAPVATTRLADVEAETSEVEELREVVAEDPRNGSIAVVCRSGAGERPVAGVQVFLQSVFAPDSDRAFRELDGEGRCVFTDLPPGRYAVADRFLTSRIERVELQAGEHATVELLLTQHVRITGTVEDELGRRIGGAAIEVLPPGFNAAPVPVTVSAVDGTFEVLHAPRRCGLGARRVGYETSAFLSVDALAGAHEEVRLVLPAGGAGLEGVVVDWLGEPVVGAVVSIGEEVRGMRVVATPGGGQGLACRRVETRSGADGSFRLVGLPVGDVQITARSEHSAPWRDLVALRAHERRVLRIRLEEGATCSGVVRDAAGEALVGIDVGSSGEQGSLPRTARSGPSGRFVLHGLRPGPLRLWARHIELGEAAAEFTALPGESLEWDPVLQSGPTLRLRVVDDQGVGLEGLPVMVHPHSRGERSGWWMRHLVTGAEGRAEVPNCPPGDTVDLTLSEGVPRRIRWEAIDPTAQEELLVRISAAHARTARAVGRVVDAAYQPVADAEIQFVVRDSGMVPERCRCAPETGAFDTGSVVAGDYSVLVRVPGFVDLRLQWDLRAGPATEIGTVVLERPGAAGLQGPPLPGAEGSARPPAATEGA